jgi:hypothetical protein
MSRYPKTNGIDCKQFKDNNLTILETENSNLKRHNLKWQKKI